MKVKDIIIKEVHWASPDSTINEAAAMMKRHGVGILPVCQNAKLVGMLTDRDIVVGCVVAGVDPKACHAREFMTSEPITVTPEENMQKVAEIMGKEQVRRLAIVDDERFVGMVSVGDVGIAVADLSTPRIIVRPDMSCRSCFARSCTPSPTASVSKSDKSMLMGKTPTAV